MILYQFNEHQSAPEKLKISFLKTKMDQLIRKRPFTFFTDANQADKYMDLVKKSILDSGAVTIDGLSGFVSTDHEDIKKWNAFIKTLQTTSVNGIINLGAIQSKTGPQWLVKTDISTNSDPIMYEYYVGRRLNSLRKFIPNFVLTIGGFQCEVKLYDRTDKKAMKMKRKPKMLKEFCSPSLEPQYRGGKKRKDFIVSEKIEPASSLGNYIKGHSAEKSVFALIQVLCALQFAQNNLDFTHYDLHAENVLMQNLPKEWTDNNIVFMYNLNPSDKPFNPNLVIPVPADAFWVVIDFGRSHIKKTPPGIKEKWLNHRSYEGFAEQGLDPMHFNPLFDPVRLVSQSSSYNIKLSAIKDKINDWSACITDEDFDMIKLNCTGDAIKGPLSMIEALEGTGICEDRKERMKKASMIVWYGNPVSNSQKAGVMRKYGVNIKAYDHPENTVGPDVFIKGVKEFPAFVNGKKKPQREPQRGGNCDMKTLYNNGKLMDRSEIISLLINLIGEEQYKISTASNLPDDELCEIISDALAE